MKVFLFLVILAPFAYSQLTIPTFRRGFETSCPGIGWIAAPNPVDLSYMIIGGHQGAQWGTTLFYICRALGKSGNSELGQFDPPSNQCWNSNGGNNRPFEILVNRMPGVAAVAWEDVPDGYPPNDAVVSSYKVGTPVFITHCLASSQSIWISQVLGLEAEGTCKQAYLICKGVCSSPPPPQPSFG